MKIFFSPVRSEACLQLSRSGEGLVINGVHHDLSQVALAGPQGVASEWIVGPVQRVAGQIVLTLLLPHGAQAPVQTLWPAPVEVFEDAEIPLPPHDAPESMEEKTADGGD